MSKTGKWDDPDPVTRRPWVTQSSAGSFPIGPSHEMLLDAGLAIERSHGGRMPTWYREFTTFDINASAEMSMQERPSIYPHTANVELPTDEPEQNERARRRIARNHMVTKMDKTKIDAYPHEIPARPGIERIVTTDVESAKLGDRIPDQATIEAMRERAFNRRFKDDGMTDDDIAASAETAAQGVTPSQLLEHASHCDVSSGESCSTEAGCAVTLTGEAMTAHLALQEAARETHAAQAVLATAQAKLKACMERWLRANGPTP